MRRRRNRWGALGPRYLASHCHVRVRFNEVDSLRVVWHGHYLAYCEEGRGAFGREYGFSYQAILEAGYIAPLVHSELDYFRPARFDQIINVETRLHVDPGARINISYILTDAEANAGTDAAADPRPEHPIAVGRSVQVFTEVGGDLVLTRPDFFSEFLAAHEENLQTDWSAKAR
jgi:acyl-CoA thioester hydrolase